MTRKFIITFSLMTAVTVSAFAQNAAQGTSAATYKLFSGSDQTEVGVHLGVSAAISDLELKPSVGIGVHVRKALDHTFSLRADVGFTRLTSEAPNVTSYAYGGPGDARKIKGAASNLISGSVQLVVSLNNGRWDGGLRKINPYVFGGVGVASNGLNVDVASGPTGTKIGSQEFVQAGFNKISPTVDAGAGIAFRISDKVNIAIEEKLTTLFGRGADLLDAYTFRYRDFASLTNVRLNFNIGGGSAGKDKKTLPLWWTNPGEQTQSDIAELKARPKLDLTDTDADGIIDMLDQEKETPAGARVDTRGVALDSDADGYADFKDKEPYSPVGFKVDNNGVAMVPKPAYVTEADVDRIVEGKLAKFKASLGDMTTKSAAPSMADWFLPMIHFDLNSASIKNSEYGNLSSVASVLKSNPSVRIAVTGFTDKTASDGYNEGLSYRRAQMAIDALVKRFGVDRSRLVLTYQGEDNTLVPTSGVSVMNRRVEFKVATSESEMSAPAKGMKSKSYKGNKSGY